MEDEAFSRRRYTVIELLEQDQDAGNCASGRKRIPSEMSPNDASVITSSTICARAFDDIVMDPTLAEFRTERG